MKHFKRPKPIWIPSRVPAAIACPECCKARGAQFVESPAELIYKYVCENCGAVILQSLEELNEPVERAHGMAS